MPDQSPLARRIRSTQVLIGVLVALVTTLAVGGILATLVDLTADWAMIRKLGRPAPTVDMRVDYHSPARKGDLVCKGRIVRMGGQFSCAEASVYDSQGKLLASGRGTYATAPPAKA